jgi:transposase
MILIKAPSKKYGIINSVRNQTQGGSLMRFYTKQHQFYCGIDLHARTMYVCIIDHDGTILTYRNMQATAAALANVLQPYKEDLVVAFECIFSWYWVADLCNRIGAEFVLGHALYMKAIHSGKVKNDKIDSQKIVNLLRSGMLPMAYVYPQQIRSTRDLLRRRLYLSRQQGQLQAHIQNTNIQYNLSSFEKRIDRHSNRIGIADRFSDPMVRTSIEVDSALMDAIHKQILAIERQINSQVPDHDPVAVHLLRSIPGIGIDLPPMLCTTSRVSPVRRFEVERSGTEYLRTQQYFYLRCRRSIPQ